MKKGTTLLIAALLVAIPAAGGAQSADMPERLSEFVRGMYIRGLPHAAAMEYAKPQHVEPLLAMLHDAEDALYWPNITKVLGLTGDDAVVQPLIDFVHGTEEWSPPIYRGRLSGLLALGYVVRVSAEEDGHGNVPALNYLLASVDPDKWRTRNVPWVMAREDEERLRRQLSVSSVLALALTGADEAADKLQELKLSGATERIRRAAESVQDDLAEIRDRGLAAYYGADKDASGRHAPVPR